MNLATVKVGEPYRVRLEKTATQTPTYCRATFKEKKVTHQSWHSTTKYMFTVELPSGKKENRQFAGHQVSEWDVPDVDISNGTEIKLDIKKALKTAANRVKNDDLEILCVFLKTQRVDAGVTIIELADGSHEPALFVPHTSGAAMLKIIRQMAMYELTESTATE